MARLPLPPPYSFDLATERFRAFGPDLANLWHEGGLHRVVGGREVRVESAPGGVVVELRGFRPPLAPDPFESLVTSITAQQVSLLAAFKIRNRMIERFGARGE